MWHDALSIYWQMRHICHLFTFKNHNHNNEGDKHNIHNLLRTVKRKSQKHDSVEITPEKANRKEKID